MTGWVLVGCRGLRVVDVLSASKFIWPLWRAARARTSVMLTLRLLDEDEEEIIRA